MSIEYKLHESLLEYVNSATDLAEAVKKNILKRKQGVAVIDDNTVIALNKFQIAANKIADFPLLLEHNTIKFN